MAGRPFPSLLTDATRAKAAVTLPGAGVKRDYRLDFSLTAGGAEHERTSRPTGYFADPRACPHRVEEPVRVAALQSVSSHITEAGAHVAQSKSVKV